MELLPIGERHISLPMASMLILGTSMCHYRQLQIVIRDARLDKICNKAKWPAVEKDLDCPVGTEQHLLENPLNVNIDAGVTEVCLIHPYNVQGKPAKK